MPTRIPKWVRSKIVEQSSDPALCIADIQHRLNALKQPLDRAYLQQYAVDHKTGKMTAHFEVDSKCIVGPHRLRPK